jgi:predicted transcriptional regulator
MRTLFDKAIEKARELPERDQDIAAAELMSVLADFPTPEERAAIAQGRAEYERGDFITHEQWRHEMGLGDR